MAYSPQLEKEVRKPKKPIGKSWLMDETYIKIKGVWHYLYRAVDKVGQSIDFYLSPHRDAALAKRFFKKAIRSSGKPNIVNNDKSGSNISSLNNINSANKPESQIKIRQNNYLNNMVEKDHRFIKKMCKPMLWFGSSKSARATLAGIELHHMLRKCQHKTKNLCIIWEPFRSLAAKSRLKDYVHINIFTFNFLCNRTGRTSQLCAKTRFEKRNEFALQLHYV